MSRVPDQNGVSQAWYIAETHHYSRKPSICTINFYHFIPLSLTLTLPGGHKVSTKQNLLASFSRTLFVWSELKLMWWWSNSSWTSWDSLDCTKAALVMSFIQQHCCDGDNRDGPYFHQINCINDNPFINHFLMMFCKIRNNRLICSLCVCFLYICSFFPVVSFLMIC